MYVRIPSPWAALSLKSSPGWPSASFYCNALFLTFALFHLSNSQLHPATSRAEVLYSEATLSLSLSSFHFFSIISIGAPSPPSKINFQSCQSESWYYYDRYIRGGCSYPQFENLLCNFHQVLPKEAFVTQKRGKTSRHYQMADKQSENLFWEILLHRKWLLWQTEAKMVGNPTTKTSLMSFLFHSSSLASPTTLSWEVIPQATRTWVWPTRVWPT